MKVLTIRQPWASLIVNGYKKYEFRSWKTNYRGKIFIHAGMTIDKHVVNRFKDYNVDYIRGAIIGEAKLVNCIPMDKDLYDKLRNIDSNIYNKSGYSEEFAWQLEDVILYKEPIFCKGKLCLWNFELE
jgi:hypothetical protein